MTTQAEETMVVRVCVCLRCGYRWQPRTDHPKRCPKCIAYDWDVPEQPKEPPITPAAYQQAPPFIPGPRPIPTPTNTIAEARERRSHYPWRR